MTVLLAAQLCVALAAPSVTRLLGRRALALLALSPASTVIWALAHTRQVFSGVPPTEHISWIPGLGLDIWFRMDILSWVMSLIVGGVGALVLVYAAGYFSDSSVGLRRFAGVFVAFGATMAGLVMVDHSMGLYAFWEGTSVLSYLLIGHHNERRPARAAARQAFLVTSSGSLAMFAGFVMLATVPGGSFRLSQLVTAAATGTLDVTSPEVICAAVLVLIGAFSKSALVPFHFWLPGAMAAPTPVSAYLHAAAMVKAGVYLIARLTPGFTSVALWSPLVMIVGLTTMIIGGYRALRQYDLKLVLAYGTVSQLGLIAATIGQGSAGAMAAGLTMLIAHAFFKSTLFLTVGAVESATGTRDFRRLCGLARRKPILATAAGLAALSMAGVPLTTGFLGKEALLSTLLSGSHAAWTTPSLDLVLAVVVAAGSVLTVAYSWRAWWGAFGTREVPSLPEGETCSPSKNTPQWMLVPICFLSLGALIGWAPHALQSLLTGEVGAAARSAVSEETLSSVAGGVGHSVTSVSPLALLPGEAHLAWWSGWEPAAFTAVILALGIVLIAFAPRVEALQTRWAGRVSVVDAYSWSLRELEILAARVTRIIQTGSLPWDLSTIMVVLIVGVSAALLVKPPENLVIRVADSPLQVGIAMLIILAALITARSRRRMRAAFALGAVGLGVAMLYASQGAPDLALTQIVVEAVSIVVFALVLRRLPRYFSDRPLASSRWWRFLVAALVGIGTVFVGLYAASARIHPAVSELMPSEAVSFGNGYNIVNVILVDIRAWDTVGEMSVLLIIATGVASLIFGGRKTGRIDRAPGASSGASSQGASVGSSGRAAERSFLPAASSLRPRDRSTILEVTTRLLFPTMLVLSLWLLFIGHNNPGGGFAGGVIAGLAFVLRYLAGGRHELGEAMPVPAGRVMGLGLFIAGLGATMPLLFGRSVLQSTPVDIGLGVLGQLHFTTAMILDVGVYVLVIGLVLDLVSATGAEIDRQSGAAASSASTRPTVSSSGGDAR